MSVTIQLGEVVLAGYSGVAEGSPPRRITVYGYVIPPPRDGMPSVHWSFDTRPTAKEFDYLGLHPEQAPKYSATVIVPYLMHGTITDKFETIERECERLRKAYRAALTP